MADLIAPTTTAATSSDFGVGAGGAVTVFLTTSTQDLAPDPAAICSIEIKNGTVYRFAALLTPSNPIGVLQGPGTYRAKISGPLTVATGVASG